MFEKCSNAIDTAVLMDTTTKYFKATSAMVIGIFITSCASEENLEQFVRQCSADYGGLMREIDYSRYEDKNGCSYKASQDKYDAIAMLRKAGVCPVKVESRPGGCGVNGYYYVAKVIPYDIKAAEKIGWRDPYSELIIKNMLDRIEFLLEKKANEVIAEKPDYYCPERLTSSGLSEKQYKQCLDYRTDKIFSEELQEEIDSAAKDIFEASNATGINYSKIIEARLQKK